MKVDEKITLEDDTEFVLLLDTVHEGVKYFLAVETKNDVPTDHYEIFRENKDGDDFYVEEVEDNELRTKLLDELETKYDELDEMED